MTIKQFKHRIVNLQRPAGRRSWFEIRNAVQTNTAAEIWIYDEIGYWGVTASDFISALSAVSASSIVLHVNSPGGEVYDGIAIYNALRNHPATIESRVDALAASIASVIAMAGDTVLVEETADMMIHDASGYCGGNAADMNAMATLLDRVSDNIAGIYAKRAGGTVDEWRERMRAEEWFTGAEAVAVGLADGLVVASGSGAEETAEEQVAARLQGTPQGTEPPSPVDPVVCPQRTQEAPVDSELTITPEMVKSAFDPALFGELIRNEYAVAPAPPVTEHVPEEKTHPESDFTFDPIRFLNAIRGA